jgi:hypothetical protein
MKNISIKLSYGKRLSPGRDWTALLLIVLAVLLISVGWNLWLFNRAVNGDVIGDQFVQPTATIDQSTLEKVEDIFILRAREAASYRNGTYSFVDPS